MRCPPGALPHGTTIVALKFPGGVVIAGDRRSTQGNMIAGRDVQKVYITDDYTATGIAGTAAIAVEFARLYAVELEHYEKTEGVPLTFRGKVNRLATMVRGNLGAALQGFVALPLLAAYDLDDPDPQAAGRIVSFDAAGGWNIEEEGYQSVGSGSIFAKSSIKKLYSRVVDADSALRVAVEALYDAADDDSATGGPDLVRGIYPTAVILAAEGAEDVAEERIAALAREVIESRSRARYFRSRQCCSVARCAGRFVSFPYFISPEQAMRERSELARKGIARGRSVVALAYSGGVLFVAENPSRSLQKVSELYDRVGFAAVGRFNEFDNLRRGGIQFADTRGYAYDRRDVTGRQLANVYAQTLGTIFTEQAKPYEVELCVAEVAHYGETKPPELYRITYDGSIADEPHFVVMGGTTEPIATALNESYTENARLVRRRQGRGRRAEGRRQRRRLGAAHTGAVDAGGRHPGREPAAPRVPADHRLGTGSASALKRIRTPRSRTATRSWPWPNW